MAECYQCKACGALVDNAIAHFTTAHTRVLFDLIRPLFRVGDREEEEEEPPKEQPVSEFTWTKPMREDVARAEEEAQRDVPVGSAPEAVLPKNE